MLYTDRILFDKIKEHIYASFIVKDNKLFFGTIIGLPHFSKEGPDEEWELAERIRKYGDRRLGNLEYDHCGYLSYVKKPHKPTLSHIGEYEIFHFGFTYKIINIEITPKQVTRKEPILAQAITKEDWTKLKTIEISIPGDFGIQISQINDALKKFKETNNAEIWIDSFLNADWEDQIIKI